MDLDAFLAERERLLTAPYDYGALADFMRRHGSPVPSPALGEAIFHKARTAWTGCPGPLREESLAWLRAAGMRPLG
jgi:hypothetical protein